MIAKITSPIPGPSTLHRPRRKSLRVVARGVVFIQRIKCVSLLFLSYSLPDRGLKGAQARVGAPNVRRNLRSELRSKTCVVDENSRLDRYSIRVRVRLYTATIKSSSAVVRSSIISISYYYFSWLNTVFEHRICMYNKLYVI
jgi:hypothetical protein